MHGFLRGGVAKEDVVAPPVNAKKEIAISNHNRLGSPSIARPHLLDGSNHVHAFNNLAKHHVLPIQPLRLGRANEELRPVRSRSRVSHREYPRTRSFPAGWPPIVMLKKTLGLAIDIEKRKEEWLEWLCCRRSVKAVK
ncbi:hypothetical protein V6N11_039723 [Hibiscus sabdariffa]|uniref:Uncharacterized protein n=1 Tax=Hibiscus sabdariffa TaxID=183260 RepID=A0ABR1ZA23_9ROSI